MPEGDTIARTADVQRAAAGIGNVYKSEVPFIEGLDPWSPVAAFTDDQIRSVLSTARRLLQANRGGGARVTTGSPVRGRGLWVYGRARRPCRRCGTLIRSGRQGPPHARRSGALAASRHGPSECLRDIVLHVGTQGP